VLVIFQMAQKLVQRGSALLLASFLNSANDGIVVKNSGQINEYISQLNHQTEYMRQQAENISDVSQKMSQQNLAENIQDSTKYFQNALKIGQQANDLFHQCQDEKIKNGLKSIQEDALKGVFAAVESVDRNFQCYSEQHEPGAYEESKELIIKLQKPNEKNKILESNKLIDEIENFSEEKEEYFKKPQTPSASYYENEGFSDNDMLTPKWLKIALVVGTFVVIAAIVVGKIRRR